MKKLFRINILALVFCLVLSIMASAANTESKYGYFSVNGYNYENFAVCWCSNNAVAGAYIVTQNDGNAPVGYMGAKARLYNDSGVLKASSDYVYNSEESSGVGATTSPHKKAGTYYSKGLTRAYNGNGYDEYTTFQTPNAAVSSNNSSLADYSFSINEKGMTYGSDLLVLNIADEPDLILAEGVNGHIGYVRSDDLNARDNIITSIKDSRLIPLYDSTGSNVIDSFLIETM